MVSLSLAVLLPLLGASALARPSPPLDDALLAREKLGARIIAELARNQDKVPRNEFVRQLLGGGDDYAPYQVPCPSDFTWIRPANGLSSGEQSYLQQRQQYLGAINTMLNSHGLPSPPRTPVIGFALSGGGLRAMTVGLGGVMGTMNSSEEAAASGLGGWSDGVTYMAGSSGGSWGTGSFMANGGMSPLDSVNNVWNLQSNIIIPSDNKVSFYYDLVSNVRAKANEGFPTQITDYWGLALGDHLSPEQYRLNTSPNLTLSSLPSVVGALGNASSPMPIIIAAEREAGEIVVPENATVWEFTPYEFGAWAFGANQKVRGAFTPLEFLGTGSDNATPNGSCFKGFDQMSYIMGTSSTSFNAALLQLNSSQAEGIFIQAIESISESIGNQENDVSRVPNTFANWNAQPNPIADLQYITLVDAGETNQNIPLEPLSIPSRQVDAIVAFDSSADTNFSWPNGTASRTTYERSIQLAQQQNVSIRMPTVPDANTFVNQGLNTRPVFFGCNETDTPIIVYVPNYPWSYYANVSTFQLQYEQAEAQAVVLNGMRSLTLNGSVSEWPKCFGCALSDRAHGYTSQNRSSDCAQCFKTWCWNGQEDSTQPSGTYEPVVGNAPSFLQSQNLTTSSNTPATSASTAAATPSKSGGAVSHVHGVKGGAVLGAVMGLGAMALGGMLVS